MSSTTHQFKIRDQQAVVDKLRTGFNNNNNNINNNNSSSSSTNNSISQQQQQQNQFSASSTSLPFTMSNNSTGNNNNDNCSTVVAAAAAGGGSVLVVDSVVPFDSPPLSTTASSNFDPMIRARTSSSSSSSSSGVAAVVGSSRNNPSSSSRVRSLSQAGSRGAGGIGMTTFPPPPATAPSPQQQQQQQQQQNRKSKTHKSSSSASLVSTQALSKGESLMSHYIEVPSSNHESLVKLFMDSDVPEDAERLQKIVVPGELFAAAEMRCEQTEVKFTDLTRQYQTSERELGLAKTRIVDVEAELTEVNELVQKYMNENTQLLEVERTDKEKLRDLQQELEKLTFEKKETDQKLDSAQHYISKLLDKNVSVMARSARLQADYDLACSTVQNQQNLSPAASVIGNRNFSVRDASLMASSFAASNVIMQQQEQTQQHHQQQQQQEGEIDKKVEEEKSSASEKKQQRPPPISVVTSSFSSPSSSSSSYSSPPMSPTTGTTTRGEIEKELAERGRALAKLRMKLFVREVSSSRQMNAMKQLLEDSQAELASFKRRFVRGFHLLGEQQQELEKSKTLSSSSSSSSGEASTSLLPPPIVTSSTEKEKKGEQQELIPPAISKKDDDDREQQEEGKDGDEKQREKQKEGISQPPRFWSSNQENENANNHNNYSSEGIQGPFASSLDASPASSFRNRKRGGNNRKGAETICTSQHCKIVKETLQDKLALAEQETMFRHDHDANFIGSGKKKHVPLGQQIKNNSPTSSSSPASTSPSASASFNTPSQAEIDEIQEKMNKANATATTSTSNSAATAAAASGDSSSGVVVTTSTSEAQAQAAAAVVVDPALSTLVLRKAVNWKTTLAELISHLNDVNRFILSLGTQSMPEAHNAGRTLHSNKMLTAASTALVDGAASFLSGAETAVTALTALEHTLFKSRSLQEARLQWCSLREQSSWADSVGALIDSGSVAMRDSLVELRCYAKKDLRAFQIGERFGPDGTDFDYHLQGKDKNSLAILDPEELKKQKAEERRRLRKQRRKLDFGSDFDEEDDEEEEEQEAEEEEEGEGGGRRKKSGFESDDDDEDDVALDFRTFKLAHNVFNIIREFELEISRQKNGGVAHKAEFRAFAGSNQASNNITLSASQLKTKAQRAAAASAKKYYTNSPEGIHRLMADTASKLHVVVPIVVQCMKLFARWDTMILDPSITESEQQFKMTASNENEITSPSVPLHHQQQQLVNNLTSPGSGLGATKTRKEIAEREKQVEAAEEFRRQIFSRIHPRWRILLDRLMTFTKKSSVSLAKRKQLLTSPDGAAASSWRVDQSQREKEAKRVRQHQLDEKKRRKLEQQQGGKQQQQEEDDDNNENDLNLDASANFYHDIRGRRVGRIPNVVKRLYPKEFASRSSRHRGEDDKNNRDYLTLVEDRRVGAIHHIVSDHETIPHSDDERLKQNLRKQWSQHQMGGSSSRPVEILQKGASAAMQRWLARRKQVIAGIRISQSPARKQDQQQQAQPQQQPQQRGRNNNSNSHHDGGDDGDDEGEGDEKEEGEQNQTRRSISEITAWSYKNRPKQEHHHQPLSSVSAVVDSHRRKPQHQPTTTGEKEEEDHHHHEKEESEEEHSGEQHSNFSIPHYHHRNPKNVVSKVVREQLHEEQRKSDKLRAEVLELRKALEANHKEEQLSNRLRSQLLQEQEESRHMKGELKSAQNEIQHLKFQIEKLYRSQGRSVARVRSFSVGNAGLVDAEQEEGENNNENNNNFGEQQQRRTTTPPPTLLSTTTTTSQRKTTSSNTPPRNRTSPSVSFTSPATHSSSNSNSQSNSPQQQQQQQQQLQQKKFDSTIPFVDVSASDEIAAITSASSASNILEGFLSNNNNNNSSIQIISSSSSGSSHNHHVGSRRTSSHNNNNNNNNNNSDNEIKSAAVRNNSLFVAPRPPLNVSPSALVPPTSTTSSSSSSASSSSVAS